MSPFRCIQDQLGEALQLSECPRIEALLDRCLLRPSFTARTSGNTPPSRGTAISVASLISFIEGSGTRGALLLSPVEGPSAVSPIAAPGEVGVDVEVDIMSMKATSMPRFVSPTSQGVAETISVSGETSTAGRTNSCEGLSPRVVPLVPKWVTSEEKGNSSFDGSVCSQQAGIESGVQDSHPGAGNGGSDEFSAGGARGPCTTLVRHVGAVLGSRGKDAYRRSRPAQPVWRKRETLIQERIVQYTTLDEEGTVSVTKEIKRVRSFPFGVVFLYRILMDSS